MSIYFFSIPAVDGATTQEDLRAFLRRHSVLAVEKHLVQNGAQSFWAIAVTIADETNRQALVGEKNRGGKETRIDYREVLDDEAFKRFVHLRELRKQIAAAEGVALYTVFTNEQIAAMAREDIGALEQLRAIAGVGAARVEKYGERFVAALAQLRREIN